MHSNRVESMGVGRFPIGSVVGLILIAAALVIAPAAAAKDGVQLEMYSVSGDAGAIAEGSAGAELAAVERTADGITAEAVLTDAQRAKLAASGVEVELVRNAEGETVTKQAAQMAVGGFNVWRSWDEPGGIRDELYELARDNPQLVKLEVLGKTHQGRELIALKVTAGRARHAATARARPCCTRRRSTPASGSAPRSTGALLHHFVDRWNGRTKEIKNLLKRTELGSSSSPTRTATSTRSTTSGCGARTCATTTATARSASSTASTPTATSPSTGATTTRGPRPTPRDETYRGPSAASEPETQAMQGLINRVKPRFQSNLHSYGQWLLYPQGWQVGTLDADYPLYVALGGTDANPAIPGFNPGQSADTLYVTNGETTDYADTTAGTIAYTPELGEGAPGAGFVFPDDEALIQAEFQKMLPFHLGLARSAADPLDPDSPVGIDVEPFYLDADDIDPQNGQTSLFDFRFSVSYGDPQEVRVLAQRKLGKVKLYYRINGGKVKKQKTSEWDGGETYGPGDGEYYHVVSGTVSGTDPGDSVEVWFKGKNKTSEAFTYEVASDSNRDVLILSAEDYTGASPAKPGVTAPQYLSYYTDALDANGVDFDIYDVDANARTAPDALGVLSHYDAVVWYTGDDVVTREPGWGPGNASRLAMQELLEVRDFVNEGGRVLYTGQQAGQQYTAGLGTQLYDPFENRQCSSDPAVAAGCLALSGSGDSQGDPIEYMFGAAITSPGGGIDPDTGEPFDVTGIDDPLTGLSLGFNGADSAQNQATNSSFIATEDFLTVTDPAHSFPQFESWRAAEYESGIAGPFDPHTGQSFMWSQQRRRGVQAPDDGRSLSRLAAQRSRSGRATTSSSTSTT